MAGRAPDPLLDRLLAPDDGRDGHDVDPAVPPNAPNPGDGHRDRRPGGPGHANAGDGHRRGRPGGPGRPGPGRCHANASSSYSGSWASNVSFAEAFPDVDIDLTHLGARHNVSIPNPPRPPRACASTLQRVSLSPLFFFFFFFFLLLSLATLNTQIHPCHLDCVHC